MQIFSIRTPQHPVFSFNSLQRIALLISVSMTAQDLSETIYPQDVLSLKHEEPPKAKGFSRKSVLPLRSLSASDMNARKGNDAGKMASMQRK